MAPKPGKRRPRDEAILRKFIGIWCKKKHDRRDGTLCPECQELLDYSLRKLSHCPLNPKPKCKDCLVHCYAPEQRARIRQVMRFSGMHLVKRGRLDWLIRYFW